MSIPRSVVITAALCLLLIFVPACKRSAVDEPSPFGPASLYLTFEVFVSPNVILTSDVRETAEVRALVKLGGEPAANQMVVFTIISGPGEFDNYTRRSGVATNGNGYAIINYVSPTKSQLSDDQYVMIQVQPQTSSPYWLYKLVEIVLLKGQ
jgi:hypothetical protein